MTMVFHLQPTPLAPIKNLGLRVFIVHSLLYLYLYLNVLTLNETCSVSAEYEVHR